MHLLLKLKFALYCCPKVRHNIRHVLFSNRRRFSNKLPTFEKRETRARLAGRDRSAPWECPKNYSKQNSRHFFSKRWAVSQEYFLNLKRLLLENLSLSLSLSLSLLSSRFFSSPGPSAFVRSISRGGPWGRG